MFNEIQEQGLNTILSRRLAMKGSSAAPSVAPELFPNLTLENDRPEWGWLKGEMLCANRITRAAVAAQFTAAQLYLPSTANAIAVVTSITNWTGNALRFGRAVGIGAGLTGWTAAASSNNARDFRWRPQTSQVIAETNANALPVNTFGIFGRLFGIGLLEYTDPIVIVPNTSLVLATDVVNEPLDFVVSWYERPAVPGELV